jgi:hypothetical protein
MLPTVSIVKVITVFLSSIRLEISQLCKQFIKMVLKEKGQKNKTDSTKGKSHSARTKAMVTIEEEVTWPWGSMLQTRAV